MSFDRSKDRGVAVELRAAEIANPDVAFPDSWMNAIEWSGYLGCHPLVKRVTPSVTRQWEAGYLARIITYHRARRTRHG